MTYHVMQNNVVYESVEARDDDKCKQLCSCRRALRMNLERLVISTIMMEAIKPYYADNLKCLLLVLSGLGTVVM